LIFDNYVHGDVQFIGHPIEKTHVVTEKSHLKLMYYSTLLHSFNQDLEKVVSI